MKRVASAALLLLAAAAFCAAQEWNEKDLIGREVYKVALDAKTAKALADKLGDIYVAYSFSGISFRDASGRYVNCFEQAYIFSVKGTAVTILGRIDKQSVDAADGTTLVDMKKKDPKLYQHVAGVSSGILKYPFQVTMVAQGIDDPEKYYETPVVCALAIDAAKKTIAVAKGK
jgi:hypothetical protein